MTNPTTAEARRLYRSIRAASGIDSKRFDAAARHAVHEICDGEEITPRMWVLAAEQAPSYVHGNG